MARTGIPRSDAGDIVEVCCKSTWRAAVVECEYERDIRVRLLFTDIELEVAGVEVYGTFCYSGRNQLEKGMLVDAMNHHPTRMCYVKCVVLRLEGEVIVVKQLEDDLSSSDDDPLVFRTHECMLKPFGQHTFGRNHQDNKLREQFLQDQGYDLTSGSNNSISGSSSTSGRNRSILGRGDSRFTRYSEGLVLMGYSLVEMQGDGNCLFRAVSHQMYGSEQYHRLIRLACMDYMESEFEYFEPFVVGDFRAYLNDKRKDGVWGDDIEIQALCEIYDRPARVMAYDRNEGAKMLRTFHEVDGERFRPAMILSFYGGGHYDSIVSEAFKRSVVSSEPGYLEDSRVSLSRSRRSGGLNEMSNDQTLLDDAIGLSRHQYLTSFRRDLESAFEASMESAQEEEAKLLEGALLESHVKGKVDSDLEKALLLSRQEYGAPNDFDDELAKAMMISSQEAKNDRETEWELSLNLSHAFDCSEGKESAIISSHDDETELQHAIEASLSTL